MPNCSAPECKGNYTSEDRVTIFKLPEGPPELRHAWIRALHREDISDLKMVYVCAKHFQEEDIEYFHKVPRGDGSFYEVPRGKLKPGAVPYFPAVLHIIHQLHHLELNVRASLLTQKKTIY